MSTSESIDPNGRVLAVPCDISHLTARKQKKENWRSLVVFLGLLCCFCLLFHGSGSVDCYRHSISKPVIEDSRAALPDPAEQPVPITVFKVDSAEALIHKLKKNHLWEIKPGSPITPLLLSSFPTDLGTLSIREKKKAFLNSLLPAALMTNAEICKERKTLLSIIDKIPQPVTNLTFFSHQVDWQHYLDANEINFLVALTRKYRTRSATKLLRRVNIIPVSLILAQGALESSWGTSRFTREGNSLFGLWTWRDDGIVPNDRDEGKSHKVEAYDSILASLRKYTLTLNRLDAYADFRAIRAKSLNPYDVVEGLQPYSERGEEYVDNVKQVISSNNLTEFDEVHFPDDVLLTLLPTAAPQNPPATVAQS